jgi:hypothetical protein
MRYMMLYKPGWETTAPPSEQEIAAMGRLIDDMTKAGVLIATGGLQHSSTGVRVRSENGKITVTDGPFVETKELVGGFAIVEVKSKAEAVELAKQFLDVVGQGESEIRPMHGMPDFAAA